MNPRSCVLIAAAVVYCATLCAAQKKASPLRGVPPGLDMTLKEFFASKHAQAKTFARQANEPLSPEVQDFFEAGENGNWDGVIENYSDTTLAGVAVRECSGAFDQFTHGEEKYFTLFAREILDSMPRGSIYFGGTDPGRWLPTAFSRSHPKADPVFTLTQNGLADNLYLKYLRLMYGDRLSIPTEDDSKNAFSNYVAEAGSRLKQGKLKPGENVKEVNGKVEVSGQVAVMQINGRLARDIFDSNRDREFFIEESFPLDWMYPYLAPHGLIMKIHRQPVTAWTAEVVRKDRDYWTGFIDRTLGQWLKPATSMEEVCEFATRVFEEQDLAEFKGDPKFVRNSPACKTFSKLRSSIGGAYTWRLKNSVAKEEKERLVKEIDLVFRQAFILCPYSPEAVFRYTNFLVEQKRTKEALLLVETAQRIDPRNRSFGTLLADLEKMK